VEARPRDESAPAHERDADARPRERPEPRRSARRAVAPNANGTSSATTGGQEEPRPTSPEDEGVGMGEADARLTGLLYLNLGKRDGVRVGELARLLRESCELTRSDIGRIRVRDRYTLVDVPEERLELIISSLTGQLLNERALAPERAKTTAKP
jgi:ATP-dependent RNA helicase DeaD